MGCQRSGSSGSGSAGSSQDERAADPRSSIVSSAVAYVSHPGKATMSERHTGQRRIGQALPRRPGSRRPLAWWQRCGLVLLVLLITAVRGDGYADVPDPEAASAQFVTIVLGAAGGLQEANLSAYVLAPIGERQFIALDAGTVLSGLQVATKMGSFADIQMPPASALTLALVRPRISRETRRVSKRSSVSPAPA